MPIPLIIWGVVAAGGAYAAWKNRQKIMEVVDKGIESFGEAMKPLEEQAEKDIEQLLSMPLEQALKTIELTVPQKDFFQWTAFEVTLKRKAKENVQASALLARAVQVWAEHNRSQAANQ